jgi:hypothetical protein
MNGDRTDDPIFMAFAKKFREDKDFHKACIDVERAFFLYSKDKDFRYFLDHNIPMVKDDRS